MVMAAVVANKKRRYRLVVYPIVGIGKVRPRRPHTDRDGSIDRLGRFPPIRGRTNPRPTGRRNQDIAKFGTIAYCIRHTDHVDGPVHVGPNCTGENE